MRQGEKVRVLDNLSTGKRDNLAPWLDDIDLIEGDIRDAETVQRAMAGHREGTTASTRGGALVAGVDYVLHQAALPSVPRSIADPLTVHQVEPPPGRRRGGSERPVGLSGRLAGYKGSPTNTLISPRVSARSGAEEATTLFSLPSCL